MALNFICTAIVCLTAQTLQAQSFMEKALNNLGNDEALRGSYLWNQAHGGSREVSQPTTPTSVPDEALKDTMVNGDVTSQILNLVKKEKFHFAGEWYDHYGRGSCTFESASLIWDTACGNAPSRVKSGDITFKNKPIKFHYYLESVAGVFGTSFPIPSLLVNYPLYVDYYGTHVRISLAQIYYDARHIAELQNKKIPDHIIPFTLQDYQTVVANPQWSLRQEASENENMNVKLLSAGDLSRFMKNDNGQFWTAILSKEASLGAEALSEKIPALPKWHVTTTQTDGQAQYITAENRLGFFRYTKDAQVPGVYMGLACKITAQNEKQLLLVMRKDNTWERPNQFADPKQNYRTSLIFDNGTGFEGYNSGPTGPSYIILDSHSWNNEGPNYFTIPVSSLPTSLDAFLKYFTNADSLKFFTINNDSNRTEKQRSDDALPSFFDISGEHINLDGALPAFKQVLDSCGLSSSVLNNH